VKVKGPLNGHSIGTPSSLNMEKRFASPVIVEQTFFNDLLSFMQNAVVHGGGERRKKELEERLGHSH
jgi:hypothetical protein